MSLCIPDREETRPAHLCRRTAASASAKVGCSVRYQTAGRIDGNAQTRSAQGARSMRHTHRKPLALTKNALLGSCRIAIDPFRRDVRPLASFERFIQPQDDDAIGGKAANEQA